MDVNSLSHTRWECKYHILFAPKFRRKVAYGELKQDIANILSMLCKRKGVEIIEAEICPDHVHMLVRIPPRMTVCCHADPVAGRTEFPMHGADETDIFPEARNLVVYGRAIALSLLYRL